MATAFTVSEPRRRPSNTFFNVATPTKTKLISPRTERKLNLASVKKTLEFTSQPLLLVPNHSQNASIEIERYGRQKRSSFILRAIPLSQYYVSLNGILENSSVIWELTVVVNDDDLEKTIESLAGITPKGIRIQCIAGDFTFSIEILDHSDWSMETKPSPGRSIGPGLGQLASDDGNIALRVRETNKIYLWTYVISTNQTFDPDFDNNVAAVASACIESSTSEEYEYYKEQREEIERHKSTWLFGKATHVIWSIVPNAFAPPNVNEFSLIQMEANRFGRNNIRISDGAPFDHRVKGMALPEKNGCVMKIGSVTKFSAGRVSSTQAFVYHEDFGCEIPLGHTVGMNISKGDSGSFMFNSKGEAVGMLIGAVKSSATNAVLGSEGCFILMEDPLRWATKVLGEEVAIVPDPAATTEFSM